MRTEGDLEDRITFFLDGVETATAAAARGIVAELTGQKKNRSFGYAAYVALLSA